MTQTVADVQSTVSQSNYNNFASVNQSSNAGAVSTVIQSGQNGQAYVAQ